MFPVDAYREGSQNKEQYSNQNLFVHSVFLFLLLLGVFAVIDSMNDKELFALCMRLFYWIALAILLFVAAKMVVLAF